MTQMTRDIADEVRKQIQLETSAVRIPRPTAEVVSDALVSSSIDVRCISLNDWKELIFEAFQTARK